MGFNEFFFGISQMNNIFSSTATYVNEKDKSKNGAAEINLFSNLAMGTMRNGMAYDMARHGNQLGNMMNVMAGYGNPMSNMIGTMGLMSAYSCSPHMFFNGYGHCGYSPMMGFGTGMGMGYTMGLGTGMMLNRTF